MSSLSPTHCRPSPSPSPSPFPSPSPPSQQCRFLLNPNLSLFVGDLDPVGDGGAALQSF
ncbi:hypothetical protein ACLOJK_017524 [Asimina triloba]